MPLRGRTAIKLGCASLLAGALACRVYNQAPASATASVAVRISSAPTAVSGSVAPSDLHRVAVDWPLDDIRDPFADPLAAPPPAPVSPPPVAPPRAVAVPAIDWQKIAQEKLRLRATILGRAPRALINNQSMDIGGEIEGFRITAIGVRQVTLSRDGVEVMIEIARAEPAPARR